MTMKEAAIEAVRKTVPGGLGREAAARVVTAVFEAAAANVGDEASRAFREGANSMPEEEAGVNYEETRIKAGIAAALNKAAEG